MSSQDPFNRKRVMTDYDFAEAFQKKAVQEKLEQEHAWAKRLEQAAKLKEKIERDWRNPHKTQADSLHTRERLITSLQYAAFSLGTETISSRQYDNFREAHSNISLPSAGRIRKSLGNWSWSDALKGAGLEPLKK